MENHLHGATEPPYLTSTTISPEEAITRTTIWRDFIALNTNLPNASIPRGCFISLDDIMQLSRDPRYQNISGVRAYFTCAENDTPQNVTEVSLILVPVDQEGNDILEINVPSDSGVVVSAVEDFTKPCPSACDVNSPLYKTP